MFITDITGMGLYFEKVDGRWWLAVVSLDVVAQSELKLFHIDRLARSYGIQKLLRRRDFLERLQNLIMYHFCLQEECQPAQLFKERIVWREWTVPESYDASEPIEKNGHLTCFAEHAEYQYLSWRPGVFSENQDEGRVEVVFEESYVWPIRDNHTGYTGRGNE